MSTESIQYQLRILYPPEEQNTLTLDDKGVLIGRGDDTDLQFEDEWISRHHCKIWVEQNTIWVEDLNSTNGTFLDGQIIQKQNILPGSKVQLGKIVLSLDLKVPNQNIIAFNPSISPIQQEVEATEENIEELDVNKIDTSEIVDSVDFEDENEIEPPKVELKAKAPIPVKTSIDLNPHIKDWVAQLENPTNLVLFAIKVNNLEDFRKNPGDESIRFLSLEISELLHTEKISDEWISEVLPGQFIFAIHSMNKEQSELFAKDLHQLISKQIYSYQGVILEIDLSLGVVLLGADSNDFSQTWSHCEQALLLAKESGRESCLIEV